MTELAVLVPVLNRPQNVAPLVESWSMNCPGTSVLQFLVSAGDRATMEAIDDLAITGTEALRIYEMVMEPGADSWPKKINAGCEEHGADWYLLAADDINFMSGWWDATATLRADPTVGVIGTSDSANGTGNPRVAAGEHTCHPLVRGDYIRDQGTIDRPGEAVHGGYRHWYVDDELKLTAMFRGAWAFCHEAVIEHRHPYWDSSIPWDDTYALGEANAEADRALFCSRAPMFGVRCA